LNINASHTALLLFARTPDEEVLYKHILTGQSLKRQKALFSSFNAQAENILKATQLPYYISNSSHQKEETFGARLYAALDDVFALEFENVLVIGNDCPALLPNNIKKAAAQLLTQDVVLGPTDKGGIYLLGLNRNLFGKIKSLDEIRWQSANVLEDLKSFFHQKNASIVCLDKLTDINQPTDLKKVVKHEFVSPLIRKIYFLTLCINKHWLSYLSLPSPLSFPAICHLVFRGPPKLV